MAHFTIDALLHASQNADAMPDGATVDKDGPAWSAFWDGGYIARLRSDGQGEQRISLPTLQVSSLTFGGGDYGDMDDSLRHNGRRTSQKPQGSRAGGLFSDSQ
jgi:sugar lactone lactonase YvrE